MEKSCITVLLTMRTEVNEGERLCRHTPAFSAHEVRGQPPTRHALIRRCSLQSSSRCSPRSVTSYAAVHSSFDLLWTVFHSLSSPFGVHAYQFTSKKALTDAHCRPRFQNLGVRSEFEFERWWLGWLLRATLCLIQSSTMTYLCTAYGRNSLFSAVCLTRICLALLFWNRWRGTCTNCRSFCQVNIHYPFW